MSIKKQAQFWRGFRAVMPLWLASAPFAVVYVIAAQRAGLSALEIQVMSLSVYSAAGQIALVQLLGVNAPIVTIYMTMILMHLHFLMYGLSLRKGLSFSRWERFTLPFFLTDVAYGVTISHGQKASVIFLIGAEMSIFFIWNISTGLANLLGDKFVNPLWDHLDFIAPLTFFALLVTLVKSRFDTLIALVAIGLTAFFVTTGFGSMSILLVCGLAVPIGIAGSRFFGDSRL